ncbi:MAG: glycosyltransferase [Nanoarchaeota archaeon]|nr:glycosyltransferase [Nanoarchaeota archaeon]
MKQISIILPTYNEKDNLPRLVNEVDKSLKGKYVYELIIVDDNSPDGTWALAQELQKKREDIKLIIRKNERGLASAIRKGIEEAIYDNIIIMDTDLSHNANTLPDMIKKSEGYDIIVASRFVKNGKMIAPLYRIKGGYIINLAIRILLNSKVKDNTGGFLLISKDKLSSLNFDSIFYGYGDYSIRLVYYAQKKGLKIYELGYTHRYRTRGRSKTSFFKMGFKYFWEILKLRIKDY